MAAHRIEHESHKGRSLLDALKAEGISMENPCKGLGTCGKCRIRVLSQDVPEVSASERKHLTDRDIEEGIRLSCFLPMDRDYTVETLEAGRKGKVLTEGYIPDFTMDNNREGMGVAVDIGTTTVVAELIDMRDGKILSHASDINPQKAFGLDVLTRITHEVETGEKGIEELQRAIVGRLDSLILEALEKAGRQKEEVLEVTIGANTTMTHMLLGVDATNLGRFPYEPAFTESRTVTGNELGLKSFPEAQIYCLPHVSAFIGSDIVAGTLVADLKNRNGNSLFIDIGTNGEIVLSSKGRLSCCSCAAGPALEGMNISSGMRAEDGAIEDLHLDEDGLRIDTIGDETMRGLCGSGILAAIRELLRSGIVKDTGAFIKKDSIPSDDYRQKYIGLNGTKREFIISENPRIVVTQGDVRQVQLAKGAILSGFLALLRRFGLKMDDLDEVLIAGQFGAHLPEDSLTGTGILPEEVKGRIKYLGNTSKTGARMALMSLEARKELEELARTMEYVELAVTEGYEDIFREAMVYPTLRK